MRPKAWLRRLKRRPGKPWTVFWNLDGKRQQEGFGENLEAAQDFLSEKLRELGQPAPLVDRGITVHAFGERWIRDASPGLKRQTIKSYRLHLRLYIYPEIGKLRVRDVHQQHGVAVLTKRLHKGHAENSVKSTYQVMRRLFARARFMGVIQSNPMSKLWVEMPVAVRSRRGNKQGTQTEILAKAMTHEQVETLVAEERRVGERFFAVSYGAALRIGEALALQIDDVDLVNAELHVQRRLDQPEKGVSLKERLGTPKGGVSRVVDLDPVVLEDLRRQVVWRRAENLKYRWNSPWLFVDGNGEPLDYFRMFLVMKKYLRRAGLPTRFGPHSLRHSYAVHMLMAGAPPAYVARQLGDALETLLKHYASVLPRGDKRHALLLRSAAEGGHKVLGGNGSDGVNGVEEIPTKAVEDPARREARVTKPKRAPKLLKFGRRGRR